MKNSLIVFFLTLIFLIPGSIIAFNGEKGPAFFWSYVVWSIPLMVLIDYFEHKEREEVEA